MRLAAESLTRPAWESVHFTDAAPDPGDLVAAGFFVGTLDAAEIDDDGRLLAAVAEALEFPDYFGSNWDALNDCLGDMSWAPAEGYAVIVTGADALWRRSPSIAAGLVASWLFAAEGWGRRDVPFHLVYEW